MCSHDGLIKKYIYYGKDYSGKHPRKPLSPSINNCASFGHENQLISKPNMASASRSRSLNTVVLLISSLLLASLVLVVSSSSSERRVARPPIVKGLSWDFYWLSCPRVERIIRKHLEDVFKKDSGQAPGILRLFFHDCFAQVCV